MSETPEVLVQCVEQSYLVRVIKTSYPSGLVIWLLWGLNLATSDHMLLVGWVGFDVPSLAIKPFALLGVWVTWIPGLIDIVTSLCKQHGLDKYYLYIIKCSSIQVAWIFSVLERKGIKKIVDTIACIPGLYIIKNIHVLNIFTRCFSSAV